MWVFLSTAAVNNFGSFNICWCYHFGIDYEFLLLMTCVSLISCMLAFVSTVCPSMLGIIFVRKHSTQPLLTLQSSIYECLGLGKVYTAEMEVVCCDYHMHGCRYRFCIGVPLLMSMLPYKKYYPISYFRKYQIPYVVFGENNGGVSTYSTWQQSLIG